MPFYLPRRHRRRLLLPPGLLALAGLLLLGCLHISLNSRLKKQVAITLFVPPLHLASDSVLRTIWPSPNELARLRVWRVYQLTGNPASDTISMRRILRYLSTLPACTPSDTVNGSKVVFGKNSKYAGFIRIISSLARWDVNKYVFETRISPPVLYILENKPKPYLRPE